MLAFSGETSLCNEINETTIADYIRYLQTKPKRKNTPSDGVTEYLSDTTIATYVRHLRAIINYWIKRGYTKPFTVVVPKADEKVKQPYTEKELELLLKKPDLRMPYG